MVKEALGELALTLERVAEQPPSVVVQVRPLGSLSGFFVCSYWNAMGDT